LNKLQKLSAIRLKETTIPDHNIVAKAQAILASIRYRYDYPINFQETYNLGGGVLTFIVAVEDGAWQGGWQRILREQSNGVYSVTFSPDGKALAGAIANEGVKLWSVKKIEPPQVFPVPGITSVAFSPDGETLACGSSNKTITLWNIKSGQLSQTLEGHTSYFDSRAINSPACRGRARHRRRASPVRPYGTTSQVSQLLEPLLQSIHSLNQLFM
jgi:Tol biopolymer transport system component